MTITSAKAAVLFLLLMVCVILQLANQVECKSVNQERTSSTFHDKSPADGDVDDESGSAEVFSEDSSNGTPEKSEKNIEVRGVLKGIFGGGSSRSHSGEGWDQRRHDGGGNSRNYGYDDRRRRPNDRRNEPCLVVREEDDHHHHHHRHHDG